MPDFSITVRGRELVLSKAEFEALESALQDECEIVEESIDDFAEDPAEMSDQHCYACRLRKILDFLKEE